MALLTKHLVQRPGLLESPGKALEQHVRADARVAQDALHDADDDVVRNEVTGGHDPRGLLADLGAARHLGAEDVARREVSQVELALDPAGLRPLPAPGRAEDDSDHRSTRLLSRRSGICIACRRRHQLFACSSSSACTAGSGPEAWPTWLSLSHRRVISTYRSASVQPGSCSSTRCFRIASATGRYTWSYQLAAASGRGTGRPSSRPRK